MGAVPGRAECAGSEQEPRTSVVNQHDVAPTSDCWLAFNEPDTSCTAVARLVVSKFGFV